MSGIVVLVMACASAQVCVGVRTSSDDLSGELLERCPVPVLSHGDLDACLEHFRGAILQQPPQVSAVHVDG